MTDETQDFNQQIINEFRTNQGRLGGQFEGAPMLLLHHTGARSGIERVSPLTYQDVDGSFAVFASNAGRDRHPAWYHNLIANPRTTIEVGPETVEVVARVADNAERTPIWERQKQRAPGFAEYEAGTPRQIPVVILEPVRDGR